MNQQQTRGRPKSKTEADIKARKQNYHKKYYNEHTDKFHKRYLANKDTFKQCNQDNTEQESMVNFELPEVYLSLQASH